MSSPVLKQCAEWELMIHGLIDGELDAAHSLQLEQHLATCASCAGQLEGFRSVKRTISQKGVRWQTPDHARAQVLEAISREVASDAKLRAVSQSNDSKKSLNILGFLKQWMFVPSLAALAASLFLVIAPVHNNHSSIEDQVLASHIRSLLVNHLTDVATSNQHTVKPWFNGKIDFSPPVVDLTSKGFPLVGGRVDYIGGRVVAALIYRRQAHLINVFIWPAAPGAPITTSHDGYNIENWNEDGLTLWAVSDVGADELYKFRETFSEVTAK